MNKLSKKLVTLLMAVMMVAVVVTGCAGGNSSQIAAIVGSWSMTEVEMEGTVINIDELAEMTGADMSEIQTILEVKEDKTFSLSVGDDVAAGTWNVKGDNYEFISVDENVDVSIEEGRLVLVEEVNEMIMYFEKN